MSPYVNASIARHHQRQPKRRQVLRLGIISGAIGAVAVAGTQTAMAHPEPEQGAAAPTYIVAAPLILRSNVTVDAWVHEKWLYGDHVAAVESGPAKVQTGTVPDHLYGMRYPR